MKTTNNKKKIIIVVEMTGTGFSAYARDYAICTTGRTIPELIDNVLESTTLYFEDTKEKITIDNLSLEIDFKQFFQYYKVLNAKYLGQKIGMNPTLISQYVHGRKKPSGQQTNKILDGIHQIGRELTEINLIHRI